MPPAPSGPEAERPPEGGPDTPVRRTVSVLLVYAVGAWLVHLLGLWLRGVLALPPMFATMLTGGLWLGAGVAALMAWHYPSIAKEEE